MFLVRVDFVAADAEVTLLRCREVLSLVLAQNGTWPNTDGWGEILPEWFVEVCAPEQSKEEEEAWLSHWRTLTREEQVAEDAATAWTLDNWLYWFDPEGEDRGWAWWDSGTVDRSHGWVDLEVPGHPVPSGSLLWMLRAAGATTVLHQ